MSRPAFWTFDLDHRDGRATRAGTESATARPHHKVKPHAPELFEDRMDEE